MNSALAILAAGSAVWFVSYSTLPFVIRIILVFSVVSIFRFIMGW